MFRYCWVVIALTLGGAPVAAQPASSPDTLRVGAVVQRVLQANLQAQVARNTAQIARNNVSWGNASFLPRVTAQGYYDGTITDATQQFVGQPSEEINGARETQYGAGATLSWTVFDGLRRFSVYDRLQAERAGAEAGAAGVANQLVADARITYYEIVRQQQQLEVLREAVSISRERLRIARAREAVGTASVLDVRQALVDLNADRSDLLRQETALVRTKAALNRLMNRPPRAPLGYAVTPRIPVDTTLQKDRLQAAAVQASPALAQAQQQVRAEQATQRAVRADFFPTLDASVGYSYASVNAPSGFLIESTSTNLTYGLTLSFDIFDGLNRYRRLENAAVAVRSATLQARDIRLQLATRIDQQYADYRNQLALVSIVRENQQAAAANVTVALAQFEQGTITSVELREVQEQFIRAESRLLDAQFEAKRAAIELRALTGAYASPERP